MIKKSIKLHENFFEPLCVENTWKEMDQRELESELQNMMKLHAEGVKQVKKMERIVRESDQRAKVNISHSLWDQ